METKKINSQNVLNLLVSIAITILFIIVLNSPNKYIWDEIFYLPLVKNVCDFGYTEKNLIYYLGSAPGPGFQLFFGSIIKFTHLSYSVHLIRLANFICFMSIPFIHFFNKKELPKFFSNSIFFLFLLLSIPFNYPLFSIGVSDTLALFFLSIGLTLYTSENRLKFIISLSCFAFASISRQTFAVFYIVPFIDIIEKKHFVKIFILFLFCMPLIYLVMKWKGIVPPNQQFITASKINLGNLITHFIYVIVLIIITLPKYIVEQFLSIKMIKYYIPISLIVSIIFLNFGLLQINNRFSEVLIPIFGSLISNLFLNTMGLISMILTFKMLFKEEIKLNLLLYKKIALFLFLFTPLFITHSYSSKYLAIVSPIWIALLFPDLRQKFISVQIVLFIIYFFAGKSIIENYYF